MKESAGRYDRSLADLMAGVAVVFLLLAVIFIRKANQERDTAVQTIDRFADETKAVRNSLDGLHSRLSTLNESLDGGFLELTDVDAGVNALEIEFKDFKFALGQCQPENTDQLKRGAVQLLQEICKSVDDIRDAGADATIILEGHTDSRPFAQAIKNCGVRSIAKQFQFENNVRLSAARAQEVFFRLRDQLVDAGTELGCLDENFVVSGRGEAAPRDKAHPDDPSNRRLVIRVRGDLKLQ